MNLPYIYTKHAIERKPRLDFIEKYAGFGKVIKEVTCEDRQVVQRLTDTGVIIILDMTKTYLITAYLGTVERAEFFYKGRNNIPPKMLELFEVNELYKTYPTYPKNQ